MGKTYSDAMAIVRALNVQITAQDKEIGRQDKEIERLKKEKDDLVLANKGRKALTGAQFSCMEKLEKEKEWLLNKCAKNECYIHNLWAPGKSEKEYKTILTDSMQQALKDK